MSKHSGRLTYARICISDRNLVIADREPLVAYRGTDRGSVAVGDLGNFFDRFAGFIFKEISPDIVAQFVEIHDAFLPYASERCERRCRKSLFNRSSLVCALRGCFREHFQLEVRFSAQFVASVCLRPCASFRTHVAAFEMCLDSFPWVVLEVMVFEDTAPPLKTTLPLLPELMPTLANLKADVRLRVALRATLLPRLADGLLLCHRHLGRAGRAKSHEPGLIGLLNRALGVNTS
jgi:hypothetical protein